MLAITPVDYQYHDTYFVVAHFHYVLVPGRCFRSSPRCTFGSLRVGKMYNESLGKLHFWLSFIGVNITFFPQHFSGLAGMPRRIPDYALQFADFNMFLALALLYSVFPAGLHVLIHTIRSGKPAEGRAWEGAKGLSGRCCHRRLTTALRILQK